MLTNFEQFHPPQNEIHPPCLLILKVSDVIEPNKDFFINHFELQNFILA